MFPAGKISTACVAANKGHLRFEDQCGSGRRRMDIPIVLTSLTKGLELLKAIREIDKNFDAATYKGKIAELMSTVADAKNALTEARDELAARDQEIKRLKTNFQLKDDNTVRREDFLFASGEDGEPIGRPYCPRCEQIDGVLIKLTPNEGMRGNMLCPQCKTKYFGVLEYLYPQG
jgi:hypothetical protein